MPINTISNQTAIGRAQSNKNAQTYSVIPPISSKKSVHFAGTEEPAAKAKNYKLILESAGALTAIIGFALDFFGKNHNVNKAIPLTLEAVGGMAIVVSFFTKNIPANNQNIKK